LVVGVNGVGRRQVLQLTPLSSGDGDASSLLYISISLQRSTGDRFPLNPYRQRLAGVPIRTRFLDAIAAAGAARSVIK